VKRSPARFCHSERSEESPFGLRPEKKERFLAPLGMTKEWGRSGSPCAGDLLS
jgi:hypothetical protein